MTRIHIVSDLHLEFNENYNFETTDADVLILSGDICVVEHLYRNPAPLPGYIQKGSHYPKAQRYREFFERINDNYQYVFYVMGNHEHYSGLWNETAGRLKEELAPYKNITLLDNDYVDIHGYRFIGTTLWTDMNRKDPITMYSIVDKMNDYRVITMIENGTYRNLKPEITTQKHNESLRFISSAINSHDGPIVVIGHHCPSPKSCDERYKNEYIMNGAFYSNLDGYIEQFSNIKLWTCGHTHHAHSYDINNTKIICNPHGYDGEITNYNPRLIIDI
jgi:Icc-related predicted phosphoesterase